MTIRSSALLSILLVSIISVGQNPAGFDQMIDDTVSGNITYISAEKLNSMNQSEIVLLDVRELEEYAVSHLKGSIPIESQNAADEALKKLPRDKTIIAYCSIGYRSELLGMKLKSLGFKKVFNLRGGIFNWINNGYPLDSECGRCVHGYNKEWSKWLNREKVEIKLSAQN